MAFTCGTGQQRSAFMMPLAVSSSMEIFTVPTPQGYPRRSVLRASSQTLDVIGCDLGEGRTPSRSSTTASPRSLVIQFPVIDADVHLGAAEPASAFRQRTRAAFSDGARIFEVEVMMSAGCWGFSNHLGVIAGTYVMEPHNVAVLLEEKVG